MIPLNYHHLYYFWVTAKMGSITKAGTELLLAQPTLSLQLKQLEKALGKTLLQRRRDGVSLTPDGQNAFEYCERIFTQGEALLRSVREGRPVSAPILRLGVASSVTRQVALLALDAIAEADPKVRTTFISGPESDLQSRLARHTLDLVLAPSDISGPLGKDFRAKLVAEIPVSFVASPALKKSLSPFPSKDREIPLLLRNPEHPVRKDIDSWLSRNRVKTRIVAETEDGYLLRVLAAQGRGVAAINDLAAADNMREGVLASLNREPTGVREYVWLAVSVHPNPDPQLRAVIQTLMSRFRVKSGARA